MKETDDTSDDTVETTGRITHEWGDGVGPSTATVEAIAAATNREPSELPPLYDYVDGDALDTLLRSGSVRRDGPIDVQFRYENVTVTISSDGHITVDHGTDIA